MGRKSQCVFQFPICRLKLGSFSPVGQTNLQSTSSIVVLDLSSLKLSISANRQRICVSVLQSCYRPWIVRELYSETYYTYKLLHGSIEISVMDYACPNVTN